MRECCPACNILDMKVSDSCRSGRCCHRRHLSKLRIVSTEGRHSFESPSPAVRLSIRPVPHGRSRPSCLVTGVSPVEVSSIWKGNQFGWTSMWFSPFSLPVDDSLLDCPHRYSYESFLRVHFFHVFGGLCGLRRSGNPPVA